MFHTKDRPHAFEDAVEQAKILNSLYLNQEGAQGIEDYRPIFISMTKYL